MSRQESAQPVPDIDENQKGLLDGPSSACRASHPRENSVASEQDLPGWVRGPVLGGRRGEYLYRAYGLTPISLFQVRPLSFSLREP